MKAQVMLPKVFNFPFTYNSKPENKIGNLVEVPFGSKKEIGVIWKNNYAEPKNIKIKDFSICGGVAANKYLNTELQKLISTKKLGYHQVPMSLCTDNAAMIGWNAIEIMKSRKIRYNNYNVRPTPNILIHEHF